MIKSLQLFNWKSHDNTFLDFSKGTNVLIGIMGSGKSSILEAISFGLYGTSPNLKRGGAKLQDIIKYGQEEAKIRLMLIQGDKEYEIERTITKKGSDALLYKKGAVIQKSPKAVTDEVQNILNVDYDLFNKIIYSEQNNIDYFFSLRPGKRKEEIDNLLGLDRFEIARTNITKIINKIKDQSSFLKNSIDFEKEKEVNNKLKEINIKIEELTNKKEIQIKEKEKIKQELEKLEINAKNLEKQKKEHQSLKEILIRKEELLSKFEKDLISLEKYKELNLDKKQEELKELGIEKLEIQISDISKQNLILIEKKSKLSSEIELAEKINKQLKEIETFLSQEDLDKITLSLKEKEKIFEDIKKQISESEIRIIDLEKSLRELDNIITSKCPICDSDLSEEHRTQLISEKTTKIKEIKENKQKLEKEKIEIKEEKERLETKKRAIEKQKDKLEELIKEKKDIIEIRNKLLEKEKELTELEDKKQISEKQIKEKRELKDKLKEEIRLIIEYKEKSKEINNLKEDINSKKQEFKTLEYDEELFNKINLNLQSKKLEFNKYEYEFKNIENELKNKREILNLNQQELEKLEKLKKDLGYFNKKEEQYSIYKNCIIETQTEVRKGLIDAINEAMMEIWPIIYPYGDYEEVRLDPQEKDYAAQLYKNNEWRDLDATASGGEKACLSLTMRIAFAMVLTPNLSWLILDEPTHNLDAQAVKMLSETLQDKIPEIVEQTFVITHDESLLNHDFNALYKLERDKSKNEATKIERVK